MPDGRIRSAVMFALCCWAVGLTGQTEIPPQPCPPDETLSVPAPPDPLEAEPQPTPPAQPENPAVNKYASMADRHRLDGRASYYSDFFDGRKTANGEIFRQRRFTAAHRTLPLGCWVVVKSIATGRKVRVKVNDRGPFTGGFVIDLSRIAARALGVDRAPDRRVEIKIVAMPGEDPPPVSPDEPTGQPTTVAEIAK